MIFLGGTSGFHYGQVVLQIHLSVGQVDFLTKFDPCESHRKRRKDETHMTEILNINYEFY